MRLSSVLVKFAMLCSVAVLVGCGDSDSESDSNGGGSTSTTASPTPSSESYPAEFEQIVADATEPISSWPGPTSSPKLEGNKLVYGIPCSKVAEGCQFIVDGVEEATKAVGWQFKSVNPEGSPDKSNEAIRQAIADDADAIVMVAIDPKVVSGPLAEAKKANIPVILVAGGHETEQDFLAKHGVFTDVSLGSIGQGELLAAFTAVHSKGKAKLAMFNTPEFPTIVQRYDSYKDTLAKCTECEVVADTNFAATEIGTTLGSKYQSTLQANPEADYAWVGLDAAAGVMVAAAQQSGASKVNLVSFDGNRQNIEFVADGTQLVTIGSPLHWAGWAALDNANRAMSGEEPVGDDGIPWRLITQENADPYKGIGFQGDIDYQAKYRELWETGSTDESVSE
jgi:ribose transport system substrate-binding protein